VKVALAAAPGTVPRSENIGLNTPVILFAVAVSVAVALLFGFFPALKSSKADVQGALKEGGRGLAGGHRRTQHVLVVVQVALALVLLDGGGLLFRSIQNLWAVNRGFNPENVITFQVGYQTKMGLHSSCHQGVPAPKYPPPTHLESGVCGPSISDRQS